MRILFCFCLLLVACAPRATDSYVFEPLGERAVSGLPQEFQGVLQEMGILAEGGQAYRYSGSDARAFLVAADQFYLENPGFCPLLENAFHFVTDKAIYMTIAAKGNEVRLFVYDRSAMPQFEFVYFRGVGKTKFTVSPCRTAGSSP